MANESKFLDTLREATDAEKVLNEFQELRWKAFDVFNEWRSLEEISKSFKTTWQSLYSWNKDHSGVPHLDMKVYQRNAKNTFDKLFEAKINRAEFADFFAELKATVEAYEKELEKRLSEKRQELNQCYDSFAKATGELQFIFEAPCVKETIMNKLLRPQTVEEEE